MTAPPPSLGPEWRPGPDGRPFRTAARVILLDEDDRVLLVRGHDVDQPDRSWWFTIGGGIDDGEDERAAAVRELFEETGLRVEPDELVGPVIRRRAVFDFYAQAVRQDEVFFLARISAAGELTDTGWTDVERDFVDEVRWWDLAELAGVTEEIFPAELPAVTAALLGGWDGTVHQLDDGP